MFVEGFVVFTGLCLGSFINVVIHRLPEERSLWRPSSRCPKCGSPIKAYDNVPILSFLWLRGRCRRCRAAISWRYPVVEAVVGALAWGLWRRWSGEPVWAVLAILAAAALVAVTYIDWDTFLIPDELSLGLLGAGLVVSWLNPLFADTLGGAWYFRVLASVGGAVTGFLICWGTASMGEALFKREALGGGDVKLLAGVGAWTGALGAFDCMMVGSFIGAVYGLALMSRGAHKRYDPIPFGPFLSAAALLNFFYLLPFGFPFLSR